MKAGSWPRIGLVALAAVALVLIVMCWNATYERVERSVDLPPRGEASYNPLYALKLALRADGVRATSRQRLNLGAEALGRHDTLLVFNDPRTLPDDDVDGLLDWVERGGHLLVRTPPPARGNTEVRAGRLLEALNLRPLPQEVACMSLAGGKRAKYDLALFCAGARFTMDGIEPRLAWGDLDAGYGYARLDLGAGTVDVLSDFDALTNAVLGDDERARWARQLLAPGWKRGSVHLVYAASMPPLWRLLFDRAWMAWLPLALAIAAWLWMRTQRFGPALPAPEAGRRALLEHVQASGEHLWRYGRGPLLHTSLRDAFLAQLRRRDPLAAALAGPAQADAIAQRTGIAAADVAHALQSPRLRDGADFRLRVARLLQMKRQLTRPHP